MTTNNSKYSPPSLQSPVERWFVSPTGLLGSCTHPWPAPVSREMGYCGGQAKINCSVLRAEERRWCRVYWAVRDNIHHSLLQTLLTKREGSEGTALKAFSPVLISMCGIHSIKQPAIIIYWNQHAGETRSLTDSRCLPHRKANQFWQTTAIIKEWNVHGMHTHLNGLETKAPARRGQEKETASGGSSVGKPGRHRPSLADLTSHRSLTQTSAPLTTALRRPQTALGFLSSVPCSLPPSFLRYPVPTPLSVPQELSSKVQHKSSFFLGTC